MHAAEAIILLPMVMTAPTENEQLGSAVLATLSAAEINLASLDIKVSKLCVKGQSLAVS